MKMTKVYSKILFMKSSRNNFICLYFTSLCVSWKLSRILEKAILKIWELISLGGVKTHFGKLALKKEDFSWYYVVAFDPIFDSLSTSNDSLNLSFAKDVNAVAKKMSKNSRKMAIYEL